MLKQHLNSKTKAIFIDKDGTLVKDVPYNVDTDKIELMPDAIESLKKLDQAGFKLFIISNQSGLARGLFLLKKLTRMFTFLDKLLASNGVNLDGVYVCPHHPEGIIKKYAKKCYCRKPAPGLIIQAAKEHNIDLEESFFIGDILNDVEAGIRAGCKTILVDNGNETEWVTSKLRTPDIIVNNLTEAIAFILTRTKDISYAHPGGAAREERGALYDTI